MRPIRLRSPLRHRRLKPRLLAAIPLQLLETASAIIYHIRPTRRPRRRHLRPQLSRRLVVRSKSLHIHHNPVILPRPLLTHQPPVHLERDLLRRPRERIPESTAAPRDPLEHIPRLDADVIRFRRQDHPLWSRGLPRVVDEQRLVRAGAARAAAHAPRLGEPSVVVQGDFARVEEAV